MSGGAGLVVGWGFVGTLLGPEGTGFGLVSSRPFGRWFGILLPCTAPGWVCAGVVVGCRPYFENCTVDASIFVAN